MTEFTPISGFVGGALIGIASVLMLWGSGHMAGISGIFSGLLVPSRGEFGWRLAFIAGMVGGALLWPPITGTPLPVDLQVSWPMMLPAGFLVGFGTRLGGGCTSGHGICGIARLSARSFVAVITFMLVAFITTYITRHLLELA